MVKKENDVLEVFLEIFFEEKEKTNECNDFKSYMIDELFKL
jgi:hypothetical protein